MSITDNEFGAPAWDPQRSERWRNLCLWAVFICIGVLVYALTDEPGLAIAVAFAKFGWNDFLTAYWLWRIDPNRRRGRACGLLYLASGLWKTALIGFAAFLGVGVILDLCRQPKAAPGALEHELIGAGVATLAGCGTAILATWAALLSAWPGRIKLYLNRAVHRARRRAVWPSLYPYTSWRQNFAEEMILAALILSHTVGSLTVGLLAFAMLARWWNGTEAVVAVFAFFVALGGPVAILWFKDILHRRVIANTLAECWPPDEAEAWLRRTRPDLVAEEQAAQAAFPGEG